MHLLMLPFLFIGVFYLVESSYKNNFIDQVRNDALILSSFNEYENEINLQFQQNIIEDYITGGRLHSAQITNSENTVKHSWGEYTPPTEHKEDFFFGEHNDNVFNIIIPRYDSQGNIIGDLFLSYDEQPTNDQISQAYLYGFYLSFIYIFITFILSLILGRQITHPIQQLRDASFDISKGHYEKEMTVKTGIQDIQQLASTLESMRHELVEKSNEMKHQAMHDSLTGLPNRLLLRQHIEASLADNNGELNNMALLMIDLDRFKEINDTLGHLVGDEVLNISANRLQSNLRPGDLATRLGGDEFAIIISQINNETAVSIAQKISSRLQEPIHIENRELQVGASIGIALYPTPDDQFNHILRRADIAMYASKIKRDGEAILYSVELENDN